MEKFAKKSILLVLFSLVLMAHPLAYESKLVNGTLSYGTYYHFFSYFIMPRIIVVLSIASLILLVLSTKHDTRKTVRILMFLAVCTYIYDCYCWREIGYVGALIAIVHGIVVKLTYEDEKIQEGKTHVNDETI